MKYFTEAEFKGYYGLMDPELLIVMDKFRELWGAPCNISPADGAIGRTTGRGFHNFIKHHTVKAIDLMPSGLVDGPDFQRAHTCAVRAGAKGIGLYPDWKPVHGIHIDVGRRLGRTANYIAKWSAFMVDGKQKYYGITRAFRR